jgi:hypothetical protein
MNTTENLMLDSLDVRIDIPETDAHLLRLIKLHVSLSRNYDTFVEPMFNMTAMRKRDAGYHVAIMTNKSIISKLQWHSVGEGKVFDDYIQALECGLHEAIKILKREGKL